MKLKEREIIKFLINIFILKNKCPQSFSLNKILYENIKSMYDLVNQE